MYKLYVMMMMGFFSQFRVPVMLCWLTSFLSIDLWSYLWWCFADQFMIEFLWVCCCNITFLQCYFNSSCWSCCLSFGEILIRVGFAKGWKWLKGKLVFSMFSYVLTTTKQIIKNFTISITSYQTIILNTFSHLILGVP